MIYTDGIYLVADTERELHEFADEIGLLRRWFFDDPSAVPATNDSTVICLSALPHYKLTTNIHFVRAKERGAVVVPRRDCSFVAHRMKRIQEMPG